MAGWTGLEPATSGVTGQHSNQLNYHPTANINILQYLKNSRKNMKLPSFIAFIQSETARLQKTLKKQQNKRGSLFTAAIQMRRWLAKNSLHTQPIQAIIASITLLQSLCPSFFTSKQKLKTRLKTSIT